MTDIPIPLKGYRPGAYGLTPQQRVFALAFASGMTQRDAAIEAGYSATSASKTAQRLLQRDEIKALVAEKMRQLEIASLVNRDFVLAHLVEVLEIALGKRTVPVLDKMGREVLDPVTGETLVRQEINLNAANNALGLLGKELAMFVERKQIDVTETQYVAEIPLPAPDRETWLQQHVPSQVSRPALPPTPEQTPDR